MYYTITKQFGLRSAAERAKAVSIWHGKGDQGDIIFLCVYALYISIDRMCGYMSASYSKDMSRAYFNNCYNVECFCEQGMCVYCYLTCCMFSASELHLTIMGECDGDKSKPKFVRTSFLESYGL